MSLADIVNFLTCVGFASVLRRGGVQYPPWESFRMEK